MKKAALYLILLFAVGASAQSGQKPKAILLDEFSAASKDVVRTKTESLKKQLRENKRKETGDAYFVISFYNRNEKSLFDIKRVVFEALFADCLDCYGIDPPRITYVDVRDSSERKVQFWIIPPGAEQPQIGYPEVWFAPINDPKKPDWEILPQEAKAGEVILSKRNELGILSNFAATPFVLDGKRYASVEGFWQMMLYPEGTNDERTRGKRVTWKYTREQVGQMTAFEAKQAGTLAEENMKTLGIDWCSYNGKKFPYRSATPGEHYRLILAAMRAKLEQNPEVKRILLATGDLTLKPDHHGEENPPPEWRYNEIWMQLRSELQKKN